MSSSEWSWLVRWAGFRGKNVVVVVVEPQASTVFWVLPEPCFLSFRDHPSQLQSLLGCSAVTHTLQGRACTLCCPFRTHTISRTHGPSAQTLYDKVVGTTGPEVGLCRYSSIFHYPKTKSILIHNYFRNKSIIVEKYWLPAVRIQNPAGLRRFFYLPHPSSLPLPSLDLVGRK